MPMRTIPQAVAGSESRGGERSPSPHVSLRMLSGEIKAHLIKAITPLVMRHQRQRAKVTDDIVRSFMTPRKLDLGAKAM